MEREVLKSGRGKGQRAVRSGAGQGAMLIQECISVGLWHTGSVLRWKLVWAVLGTEGAFKGQAKVGMWLGAAPACWSGAAG